MAIEEYTAGQQIVFANTANNVSGVLAVAMAASDTTASLTPGGGALFPAAPFYVSIEFEVLWCLSKSGDNLIVQRGQDGTTAASHVIGSTVEMRNNAGLWNDAYKAINNVSTDVGNTASNVTNKTLMPPDTVYLATTQELTHKTIDLSDGTKGNVIIGNVSPDPSQLVYQNLLNNGGFEEWYMAASTTLAAGTPTSGVRTASFSNFWQMSGINDSAITCARDTANIDPGNQSGVDNLINVSTVQAADNVGIWEEISVANGVLSSSADLLKLLNNPLSISARVKVLSGTPTFRFRYSNGVTADTVGPWITPTTAYATYKFENQVVITNPTITLLNAAIDFHGVGQLALDNIMLIVGSVATNYRPKFLPPVKSQNLLTNGGFEIWQRGTGPFSGGNLLCADRWKQMVFSGTLSIQRSSSAIDTAGGSTIYSAQVTNTNTTQGNSYLDQTLNNADGYSFYSQFVTASVRVNVNIANAVCIGINDGVTAFYSPYHSGSGQYETLVLTFPATANYVRDLRIYFDANCTAYLDNAMLVIGQIPASYIPLTPADDLARCKRYCQRIQPGGINQFLIGFAQSTVSFFFPVWYPIEFAVTPSFTISAVTDWSITNEQLSATQVTNLAQMNNSNRQYGLLQFATATAIGTTGTPKSTVPANANAWMQWEANP